ncbi:MAG: UDP-N-acetylmuramoyl-tripeptide--D-alanyl-D-alanine ligase [Halioglobus sp.]
MMRSLSMNEIEAPLHAHLQGMGVEFTGVTTDSRNVAPGDIFVALRGANFDGHEYLHEVAKKGAVAALVSRDVESTLPLLRVADTQRALGLLGAYNRELFPNPVVAITGSSGKTTVKNMLACVLGQRGNTLATQGNYNNEIGVPQTLLRLAPEHDFAVVEMGAGREGDIRWLCELGKPNVSILLNAMPAHLEGFGSVEVIARAKGEIFDQLGAGDTAIINADQPWSSAWRERAGDAAILDFGVHNDAAVKARDINVRGVSGVSFTADTPAGDVLIDLALPGEHNVMNALAAIAAGLACQLSPTEIASGLRSVVAVEGRLARHQSAAGAILVDDCYNANPGSVRAAIDLLAACPERRTLVLGAMRELGPESEEMHRAIGEYARERGLQSLCGVGPELQVAVEAFGEGAHWYSDRAQAIEALASQFGPGDIVLIKGSRSAGMESVLQALIGGRA